MIKLMWRHHNKNCTPFMVSSTFSFEDKVFKAIERLLRTSGYNNWNITSVFDEANKYCYKTVSGEIGVVNKDFINQRVIDGVY